VVRRAFLKLCETVFQDPTSYFQHFAHLTREEAITTARSILAGDHGKNLAENILPTRSGPGSCCTKGADHRSPR